MSALVVLTHDKNLRVDQLFSYNSNAQKGKTHFSQIIHLIQ